VIEFGLRRAQGFDGAVSASRATYIGGACGTSNTLAGKIYGIPVMGTMAHSWVMSFDSEEEAFNKYAELYPDKSVFLIDTYDTLKSGIHSAIKTGKKMSLAGKNFGVRLDSGDIHYLSKEVRRLLDEAGLSKAGITVSNDLDEIIIENLVKDGCPVDSWGVGTKMVTGAKDAAFSGVYKLAARSIDGNLVPVMKVSDNQEKMTDPGIKQVWRIRNKNGNAVADVIGIDGEEEIKTGRDYIFWHPAADYRRFNHTIDGNVDTLLKKRINNGKIIAKIPSLAEIKAKAADDIEKFDSSYKRLLNPHIYKVSITYTLRNLKLDLIQKHLGIK
jgi:nicotinate phosphoribosyltransferase